MPLYFDTDQYNEMSLIEITSSKTKKIRTWDNIIQRQKPNLFQLIKHKITNHIKPNIIIKIGESIFNCHMIVLQCYSNFFSDKTLEQSIELPTDKVKPDSFTMIYKWMLSSDSIVQRDGLLRVFIASEYLQIKSLVEQCWACLDNDKHFAEDRAFLLYLEARECGYVLIQQLMFSRVSKFFLTLVATQEFLELTSDELCMMLQSNSIGVNQEIEVLMSAIRWLNYDWENRQNYLIALVDCVRFGLMTSIQLLKLQRSVDSVEVQKIVEHPNVKEMINEGFA